MGLLEVVHIGEFGCQLSSGLIIAACGLQLKKLGSRGLLFADLSPTTKLLVLLITTHVLNMIIFFSPESGLGGLSYSPGVEKS